MVSGLTGKHPRWAMSTMIMSLSPITVSPPPPPWSPQPILVSTWLELAIWALAVLGNCFEPAKFAKHLISPHLFTFKMLQMS